MSFNHPTNATMGGFYGLGFGMITNDDHAKVVPGWRVGRRGELGDGRLERAGHVVEPVDADDHRRLEHGARGRATARRSRE